jgi:serine/threonine protein kinase
VILSAAQVIRTALDIASGVHYLHSLNPRVVHRDLKSASILLGVGGCAKIADFGLSRVKSDILSSTNSTRSVGDWQWLGICVRPLRCALQYGVTAFACLSFLFPSMSVCISN